MIREAPKVPSDVLVSDLVAPPLVLPIMDVLKYDTDHDAWHVSVKVDRANGMRGELWVRERTMIGHPAPHARWKLYDIGTPLPAKVAR